MQKLIAAIILLIAINCAFAQPEIRTDALTPLKRPKSFVQKYVNFDVVKLMYGHGFSAGKYSSQGFAGSFDAQILLPRAMFRDSKYFHIAYGIGFGRDAIKIKNARYEFTNNKLAAITEDQDIRRSVQKVGYVGVVLLPFFTINNLHVMTGISARVNTVTKLKIYPDDNKIVLYNAKQLNPVTLPLLFQMSYSSKQLFSRGIYASYDLVPRFKGKEFKNIKQMVIGLTFAARI